MIARVAQFPVIEGKGKRRRRSQFQKLAADVEMYCPQVGVDLVESVMRNMLEGARDGRRSRRAQSEIPPAS